MTFKIALGAGHGLETAGKRCLKSLDPNETREWWLNDRICDYIEFYLKQYDGYELLRLDDSDDGKTDVALSDRVKKVNKFMPNIYISIHHNAGVNGGTGGGIEAYVYRIAPEAAVEWQRQLYASLIKHTGLKGNRAKPLATANFQVLRESKWPAVLLELGFMDSVVDVPIILSKEYAQKCARAIVEVLVKRGGLSPIADMDGLKNACQRLHTAGIIASPDYWAKGKGYSDANVVQLILKMADHLKEG